MHVFSHSFLTVELRVPHPWRSPQAGDMGGRPQSQPSHRVGAHKNLSRDLQIISPT